LASKRGWILLTGDGELRSLAQAQGLPFFGVLWVCDQIFDGKVIETVLLADGLEAIGAHPRCRLPKTEIRIRIERYRQADV
jgi:hypothetical protein